MLSVEELQARTYEERMTDVMRELPLRSKEWTNYNASDPGITILENLTAFSALQGAEIVTLNYRAKMALLKMAGFIPTRGKCSRVLLSADTLEKPVSLIAGQRFTIGDLCFETNRETLIGQCRIKGVYSCHEGEYHDISYVLDRELSVPVKPFGEKAAEGDAIYFMIEGDPSALKETIFYMRMAHISHRNETEDRTEHIFADASWECYTENGFEATSVRDFTGAFVNSGEVRIRLPEAKMVPYPDGPEEGYCIRVTLTRSEYDIVPRLTGVYGFLFEVWQKETYATSQTFSRIDNISVVSSMGPEVYYLVFGKEKKGSSYRRYELSSPDYRNGRFCTYSEQGGKFSISFNEEMFGYVPQKGKECVRIIMYNEEIMRRYSVGKVIGFDDQEMELPLKNIVPESFFLIARRKDEEGYLYDFVRPEKKSEGALYYHLLEGDGRIVIEDPGDFIDADLFMGAIAITAGPKGNVNPGGHFRIDRKDIKESFFNPGAGTGGTFRESFAELNERFRRDMRVGYTAVTARDYEEIARNTPGLCIRKTKAVMNENENLVQIAVMPDTDEQFPKLSPIYLKRLAERLEERRLITSQFRIIQPSYVGIAVRCTVYVKRHYHDCKSQIEERIRKRISYLDSEHNFGERLRFEDVFHGIEELPCVEYVYELSLHSENTKLAQVKEYDIYPRFDCLCYPGEIQLQLVTSEN